MYDLDSDDLDSTESDALAEIEDAMATCPNTHGNTTGIQVSGPQANGFLTWSEIAASTTDTTTDKSPPHSFVILYSCITFPSKTTIASSFRLRSEDGAYLGFPVVMSWDCFDGTNPVGCNKWVEELLAQLEAGKTLGESLRLANLRYRPLDNEGNPQDMLLHGDEYSTLKWVYLPSAERAGIGGLTGVYQQWIKVYD
jgi:hypothetical protein